MINENIIIINMVIYNDLFWTNYIFNNSGVKTINYKLHRIRYFEFLQIIIIYETWNIQETIKE